MRFGSDASLLDLARGELVPFNELVEELLSIIRDDAVLLAAGFDDCEHRSFSVFNPGLVTDCPGRLFVSRYGFMCILCGWDLSL